MTATFDIFAEDLSGRGMPLWWTPDWLGQRWSISRDTITRQCARGDLEARHMGGQWRIHRRVIESREAGGMVDLARVRKVLKVHRKHRMLATVPNHLGDL